MVRFVSNATGPEAMRATMAAYVAGAMGAYADAAAVLAPADRARMPLLAGGEVTIAVVGTRYLHLVGTAEHLPAPTGQEVAIADRSQDLRWQVRFYDPVIIPALGLVDEAERAEPGQVRSLLGIRTHLFHLVVGPGSGLTPHHAQHAGTGLAHAHASAVRDFEAIAVLAPDRADLVQEMHGAAVAGLVQAHALLAERICPVAEGQGAIPSDPDRVRSELLARLRAGRP